MIWGGSGGFCSVERIGGCRSGTVIWVVGWLKWDECAVW